MKILKLHTLRQFIELIRKTDLPYIERYLLILNYYDFLKQQIEKEMFINEVTHPNYIITKRTAAEYNEQYKLWKAAENQILFKNINIKYRPLVFIDDFQLFNGEVIEHKTMNDFAEATLGTVELKGIHL